MITRAANKAANKAAKQAARKQAKVDKKIEANRAASEQALFFGNSRKGQDAWAIATGKQKNYTRSQEEMDAFNQNKTTAQKQLAAAQARMKYLNGQARGGGSKEDRLKMGQQVQSQREKIEGLQKNLEGFKEPLSSEGAYGAKDRLKALGSATAEYYIGGSGKQMAARIGGTVGGIVGLNVGLDALENSTGGRGY